MWSLFPSPGECNFTCDTFVLDLSVVAVSITHGQVLWSDLKCAQGLAHTFLHDLVVVHRLQTVGGVCCDWAIVDVSDCPVFHPCDLKTPNVSLNHLISPTSGRELKLHRFCPFCAKLCCSYFNDAYLRAVQRHVDGVDLALFCRQTLPSLHVHRRVILRAADPYSHWIQVLRLT